jgi:hypothetical protein
MSESQNHSLTSGAAAPVSVDFREKKNRHRLWTSCSSILLNWQIATAKTRPNGLLPQRVVSYLSNEFDDFLGGPARYWRGAAGTGQHHAVSFVSS